MSSPLQRQKQRVLWYEPWCNVYEQPYYYSHTGLCGLRDSLSMWTTGFARDANYTKDLIPVTVLVQVLYNIPTYY